MEIKKPVHQTSHLLVSPPFDVLVGISYCPPLTDPFFYCGQLQNTLHQSEEKSQALFWALFLSQLSTRFSGDTDYQFEKVKNA